MSRARGHPPVAGLGLGVGYVGVPGHGVIEALRALDPDTGRTMCGRTVAISWAAHDASGTTIDCWRCQAAINRTEEAA